jgi:hypothetical protein
MTTKARTYEAMGPISRPEADAMLGSGDPQQVLRALLRLSLHGPDFAFAERMALEHVAHPDRWVRCNAATALGHVARVHGSIDPDAVMRALVALLDDPHASSWADDALDDVEHAMKTDRSRYLTGRKAASL